MKVILREISPTSDTFRMHGYVTTHDLEGYLTTVPDPSGNLRSWPLQCR